MRDRTLYFIECDFGRLGHAFVERSFEDMGRSQTLRDIRDGQFKNIVCIIECNAADGTSSDVTEDFLRAANAMEAA